MPLLALNLFARIVAMRVNARPIGALHALAVDDGRGRTGLTFLSLATFHIECVMNGLQRAVIIPQVKVTVDRAFRREVLRQIAPLASRREHVHNAVDDFAYVRGALAASLFRRMDQRRDMLPFFVAQITRVSQMAAVIALAVLDRPHSVAPSRESGHLP